MKYSVKEMKQLYDSIENSLDEKQKEIIKQMISNYNKLFVYVRNKIEDMERKRKQYLTESEKNDKLIMENRNLQSKIYRLEGIITVLKQEKKELQKKLK